jgi:hypothetical protein
MPVLVRYFAPQIKTDLARKMVFVAGPRQVGKTTLAKSVPGAASGYLNWDVAEDRSRILARELIDRASIGTQPHDLAPGTAHPRRGGQHDAAVAPYSRKMRADLARISHAA